MEQTAVAGKLAEALEREVELLEHLSAEEQALQNLLIHRNWESLERRIKELNHVSETITEAEEKRHRAYADLKETLGLEADTRFYDVLERLPVEDRTHLSELYRRLKIAVVHVRSITGGIDTYVTESSQTMRRVLEELFPEQRGKIYSRNGVASNVDERAMVLDHHL